MASYINGIHTFIQFLSKKERGVFIDHDQIDDALNRASMNMFIDEYRKFESSQEMTDNLRVFKVTTSLTPVAGLVTLPANYSYLIRIGYQPADATKEEIGLKVVNEAHWHNRINRKTAAPSLSVPVCIINATTIEVRPKTLPNVKLTYFKVPTDMLWGYTVVSGRPVYADTGGVNGTSVDPEWPEITHNKLIMNACSLLSLHVTDQDLLQYSEAKSKA